MADKSDWYLAHDPKPSLYSWIFQHMAMGAIYAALVFFGIIAIILVIRAIGFMLPDDPFAALETGARALGAIV